MQELPEQDLYHYTGPDGFLGMLQTNALWLTHGNYLNDSEEFYHSFDLIQEIIEHEIKNFPIAALKLDKDKIFHVYSFSLTTQKDLLSQWRGYCPEGGYCFSIDKKQIQKFALAHNLQLNKCLYQKDEKVRFIKKEILRLDMQQSLLSEPNEYLFGKKINAIRWNILKFAAIMKNKAFIEEQEWRLTTIGDKPGQYLGPPQGEPLPFQKIIRFRPGRNTLIPYLQLSFVTGDNYEKIINEVVIGPTPDKILAKNACEMLLKTHYGTEISSSEIPYKNW